MRPRFRRGLLFSLHEQRAGKELVVLLLVEPRAFDVEEFQARHADGERECVDRQLRDGLVGARIGFVIEDVHGIVAYLQKVDMAGDASAARTRRQLDTVSCFEVSDLVFGEPDRNLDCDGARVVREQKILQRLVPQLVVADGGNDQRRSLGRGVLFAIDDEAIAIGECRLCLRGARLRIVLSSEEFVRTGRGDVLKERRERFKALMLRIAA